ncbi:hypothetical protein TIFTF001_005890 [Ficus carica]|uniref:Uncharacterized protein n=1 Tax=Ficus carica TaxID=3494 RepID=A0AA88A970_FICCA|nr:hypothetical protein TIFTF001_005890 [Ficus carica]
MEVQVLGVNIVKQEVPVDLHEFPVVGPSCDVFTRKPSNIGLAMAAVEKPCISGFKLHLDADRIVIELLMSGSCKLGVLDDFLTPVNPSVTKESPSPTGI